VTKRWVGAYATIRTQSGTRARPTGLRPDDVTAATSAMPERSLMNRHGNSYLEACWIGLIVAFLMIFIVKTSVQAEDVNDSLNRWLRSNIFFSTAQDGSAALFVRKKGVRARVISDTSDVTTEITRAIGALSTSFGLNYEFTAEAPNLIVAIGNSINDGDKPNKSFLKELGLPDPAIEIVSQTRNWSSGCGFYSFTGRDGHISASIVAGDKRLTVERLKDCVISGVIFSFGLRTRASATFDTSQGYIQYLLLASAIAACEGKQASTGLNGEIINSYTKCITDKLVDKITR
jgi:hypothetical protein